MEPQFDHVDAGNDDLLNKILWFAACKDIRYPYQFDGREKMKTMIKTKRLIF
ncbi:MAG: hypothetical protein M0P33_04050 [Massilibacteroides sp.]|nr:hypothetical protein [Massilibacteroides sp.]